MHPAHTKRLALTGATEDTATVADVRPARQEHPRPPLRVWGVPFLLLSLLWGSSFLFIKVAVESYSPVQVAFGRLAIGALMLIGLVYASGGRLPRSRRTWAHSIVTSLFLTSAVATPIIGRLGDIYGRSRMLLFSFGCLIVGTTIGALSGSIEVLQRDQPVDIRHARGPISLRLKRAV